MSREERAEKMASAPASPTRGSGVVDPFRQAALEAGTTPEAYDDLTEMVRRTFEAHNWRDRGQFPTHDPHIPYPIKVRHFAARAARAIRVTRNPTPRASASAYPDSAPPTRSPE